MAERILATRQLTKRYGHTAVLQRVDMHIEQGQIYGLVGKNGAGKTTLMRLIAAQSLPSEGVIELFGKTSPWDLNAQRARVGAIIETPSFYPFLTAEQNLEYYRIQRGIPSRTSVREALQLAGLSGAARKKFKHFSLGMKQRLGLALAVMGDPELLLLDEPINGLDPMGIVQFREILQNLNAQRRVTILISSHILSELSNLATHYGFLDQGRMLQQTTAREIHDSCRQCLELAVDDAAQAAIALEQALHCTEYEVLPGNRLRVYAFLEEPARVSAALAERGVSLAAMQTNATDLEGYFLNLIERAERSDIRC